ncbi:MAG: hypothetical protein WA843_01690, partial [Candidatus Saccharimonadales bacterium]
MPEFNSTHPAFQLLDAQATYLLRGAKHEERVAIVDKGYPTTVQAEKDQRIGRCATRSSAVALLGIVSEIPIELP